MAKMSEKQNPPKSSVCENFEPQAWRKTVCKNCFQAPEKHMAGGGAQSDSGKGSHGKEKMHVPAAGTNEKGKPAPGKTPMTSSTDKDISSQKSAATSLKDKYEQLERDKHKPKDPPKVAPKNKGLSLLTNKYESVSGPSTPSTPGTPSDKMEKPNIPHSKQGRMLDIKVSDRDSDEDVKSGKVIVNKLVKSKFGSIDNVSDTEESSKFEVFQRSKFGSMENISMQNKKKEPIPIPIQKSKFSGSLDNVSSADSRHGLSQSNNKAMDLLNKLDNFSIEIRAGATSNIGSTVIHQQEGGKVDIISIPIKRASAPNTPTVDTPKPWSNKETVQNQLNENKQIKGCENDGRLNVHMKKDVKTPSPERDNKPNFLKNNLKSSTPEKFSKLNLQSPTSEHNSKVELKSPTPEKIHKVEMKSPTPDKDKKPDFKLKIEKPELKKTKIDDTNQDNKNEKFDFRSGLKKHETGDSSKTEQNNKVELKSKATDKFQKIEVKSPTPDKDKKPDFKLKSDKPDVKKSKFEDNPKDSTHEKVDFRLGLKKHNTSNADTSKPESNSKIDLKSKTEEKFKKSELKSSSSDQKYPKQDLKANIENNLKDSSKVDFRLGLKKHSSGTTDSAKQMSTSKTDLKSKTEDNHQKNETKSTASDEKNQIPDLKAKDKIQDLNKSKSVDNIRDNKNEKVDFRLGLKKHGSGSNDNSNSEKVGSKSQFEIPALKTTKLSGDKDIDGKGKSNEPKSSVSPKRVDDAVENKSSNSVDLTTISSDSVERADEQSKTEQKSEHDDNKTGIEHTNLKPVKNDETDVQNLLSNVDTTSNDTSKSSVLTDEIKEDNKSEKTLTVSKTEEREPIKQTGENSKELDMKTDQQVLDQNKDESNMNAVKKDETKDTIISDRKTEIPKTSDKDNETKPQKLPSDPKELVKTETKSDIGNKSDSKQEKEVDKQPGLLSKFSSEKDGKKTDPLQKADNHDSKTSEIKSKFGKADDIKREKDVDKQPELLSKFSQKDEKKMDTLQKVDKHDDKKIEPKSKFGKDDDSKHELLSRFATKDEVKTDSRSKFDKPEESKPGFKPKFGKQEAEKSELLSKFAKQDDKKTEPKPKIGRSEESKAGVKSKFGKQEEEKSELLSRFAKKDDKKTDIKSKFDKPDEKKTDIKSKFGKPEDEKSELLSRFAKKDEKKFDPKSDKKTELKSKFSKPEEEKSELLSRFSKKDEKKVEPKFKTGISDDKPGKLDPFSKFGNRNDKNVDQKSKFDKQEEKKQDFKSKFGKQDDGKSELLSRFDKKKDEPKDLEPKDKVDSKKPWLKTKMSINEDKKSDTTSLKKDTKLSKDSVGKQDSKTELNKPDWRSKREEGKNELKSKFEKNDNKAIDIKSKFDKPDLKKNDYKSKFEKPVLKSSKSDEQKIKSETPTLKSGNSDDQGKQNNSLSGVETVDQKTMKVNTTKTSEQTQNNLTPVVETDSANKKHADEDIHSSKLKENENASGTDTNTTADTNKSKDGPPVSHISKNHFDHISTDGEAILADVIDACAPGSADDDSHVHVDTQVFTSTRQKTAGVIGQDEIESYAASSRIGLSDLHDSRSTGKNEDSKKLQNGDISYSAEIGVSRDSLFENYRKKVEKQSDEDMEKLKSELKIMIERCNNLEKENEQLLSGLEKKDSEVRDVKKDKSDVEASIKVLQNNIKSMEEKCTKLEADNVSLSKNLQTHQDTITANINTKEDEHEDKMTANDKIMADIVEENETLKEEINELKLEMDEMYDSFRDQEAEEFRELQRELEITAKNCRILQFKLRKMERHGCQLEQDKQHVEEKLRMLQNQFQDRDAVSHIHSLEDELRMAKDVSVRLHDELDLMEDKRGKLEEENRHLTELLEQADRKQFRLEMEVDKLRDKIVDLKQELRQKENPNAERKVPLAVAGRQDSLEREMHQLKKELYDSREREADLRDHLQFLEGENKTLQKKVTGLEEDNDSLSKQLKKMSIERAIAGKYPSVEAVSESEVELSIQFDLAEKELTILRRKMQEMDEENEMLHSEMFSLEQQLKEKNRQLETLPEPSSPTAYYEDKIKEYEKEADEYRSKLLQRENEIERLYAQLSLVQCHSKQGRGLRKSRSLECDTDYDLLVDLRRQLELSHQECSDLRDRIESLVRDNASKDQELNCVKAEFQPQVSHNISALAVAYIDSDNEVQLRKQLAEMEHARSCLHNRIQGLSVKVASLAKTHYFTKTQSSESISKIPKPFVSDGINQTGCDMSDDKVTRSSLEESSRTNRKAARDPTHSFTFTGVPSDSSCNYVSSDTATGKSEQQTINEKDSLSRDPYKLLSVIDDIFCEVLQNACDMESERGENIVPFQTKQPEGCDSPELPGSSDMSVSRVDFELTDDKISMDINNPIEDITVHTDDTTGTDFTETADFIRKIETRDLALESDISKEINDNNLDKNGNTSHVDKIAYLEEEIDDLRLIIKSKEEKKLALEDEVTSLETSVKTVQDESRRREMELLNEMDLIHDKNEILNNLLEIVQQRAEAAESELERVLAEIHENESTDSSDKATPLGEISDGSDDVFDGSPADRGATLWEEQFKKRIRSLETLLAEERKKVSSLEKKLEINRSDVISTAMSDDSKLHQREKEILQSELQESQRHAKIANDQIRNLTEKLKKVESEKISSPAIPRKTEKVSSSSDEYEDAKDKLEPFCKTCSELQSVKDQLCEELYLFKDKADELEGKVEEINAIWISKNAATEKEKHLIEQKLKQKFQDCKKVEDQLNKLREEDRMKDIFLKERDTNLKDKTAQIVRKDEIIQEQEDIIRQREEDMQQLFDQISQREKNLKEQSEQLRIKEEKVRDKDNELKKLQAFIDEKNEEMHFLEEEMHETTKKRKESESLIAEMKEKLDENIKGEKSELETENERLQSDVENLMTNITQLHNDKVTLQNELDKSKQALSEAMLMWDRDRSTLGSELAVNREKLRMVEISVNKKETQAVTALRKEVHSIIETKERIALQAMLSKIEHDNAVRLLKNEKFKLTEELTSKIRMLTHEMTNNDKMADELSQLRGQDDINYQLHHHEKLLRAEYMAMKVRYESQLDRLQKEHMQLLAVVERLQREKNLDTEIITGIQKGMSNIKETYTHDLSRWKDERTVLESHIKQIEEGREIACHLRAQIDALKQQLSDQDIARTELVNKMTSERQRWDIEKANLNSTINQLEEQLAVFVQVQSKSQDTQFRMEIAWEKEREDQKRLLAEAHNLAMDLQGQMQKRDEEHTREKKNLLEQIEKQRQQSASERSSKDRVALEVTTSETKIKHLEQMLEDTKEKHKKEEDSWMKEKGDMLRKLAEMRKAHLQDSRRIDDVLTALKRLRELAAIVMESENSAMLPSNGTDGTVATGDASAASSSVSTGEGEMDDLKQNIDQIILKYVKESLRQIHIATEELAKPPIEVTREERQKIRRSLSSSEIDLLKEEFLVGPQDPGRLRGNGVSDTQTTTNRERKSLQRTITHDGNSVTSDHLPSDYIENILMEQSTFYKDGKDTDVEVHRIRSRTETTRVETSVTSLPKPPPSFLIPRSRSTSPGPQIIVKSKRTQPIINSISVDTTHQHRLSAPLAGASSRSSSADSSPIGIGPAFIPLSKGEGGLPGACAPQSGSLDRLSPSAARKRFFEEQSNQSPYLSWPERHKKPVNGQRNSKSLSNSSEFGLITTDNEQSGNGQIRSSVSMDVSAITPDKRTESGDIATHSSRPKSQSTEHVKHTSLMDMFKTMKRKLKPKVKRSQSDREFDRTERPKVTPKHGKVDDAHEHKSERDEKLMVHEKMTPIDIPPESEDSHPRKSRKDAEAKKDRSKSPKARGEKEESQSVSAIQKLKKRFRSKSADRANDRHVTPILVGHSAGSQTSDSSWQFSETCV